MKSCETLLSEVREQIFAAEKTKGFSEAATQTAWNDKMKSVATVEEKLSIAKKHLATLTESRRIVRNNGSGGPRSNAIDERVKAYSKKLKVSLQEAALYLGVPFTDNSDGKADLREAWKRYCPVLNESEIDALVRRGVPVPKH